MEKEPSFRILVLTDNHMGYNNLDTISGKVSQIPSNLIFQDSFEAVEEILQRAKDEKVDFVIQGGDLFHDANPSLEVLNKGMEVFTNTIYGKKEHDYKIKNLDKSCSSLNLYDRNINIAVPVFSIHGNHDYPTNSNWKSVLEILKTTNLINYFGKKNELDFLIFDPIFFVKKTARGKIGIALYGLGNCEHQKLGRVFRERKYKIRKPDDYNEVEYTSIMVMHQNRYKGKGKGASRKNCIEFEILPKEIDLYIWGHEHDCYTEFESIHAGESFVYQPGSSVATSLTEGEAKAKHYGILRWDGRNRIQMEKTFLIKSQRHIEFETLRYDRVYEMAVEKAEAKGADLEERSGEYQVREEFERIIKIKVEDMTNEALESRINREKKPLVRLRIIGCPPRIKDIAFDPKEIEEQWKDIVANSK